MRLISATFLGGCLLGLVLGCSSKSNKVELPQNPAPPPTHGPTIIGGGGAKSPAPPLPGATPAPTNK